VPGFDEARETILARVAALGAEVVPLLHAVGRALATDQTVPWDMPRWDNSAMDGYAVRAADCARPDGLELSGFVPAGSSPEEPLAAGTAVKILTGAPLPAGADAVVPFEHSDQRGGRVVALRPPAAGANVRRRGEDLRAGEVVLRAGSIVGSAEVSLLASLSRPSVAVVRRPTVAILSNGDELLEPGEPLAPGKIYDSNALALAAAAKRAGATPILLPLARDDRGSLSRWLSDGLRADALVTSAGVSVGDRDLVREVLRELAVEEVFWKVDIQPGRPTAFAVRDARPIFSLPGNPVAALLTFELFVRPALRKMMGHPSPERPLTARLGEANPRKPDRAALLRVRLERAAGELVATSAGKQQTGLLRTMLRADGVAVLPPGERALEAGQAVSVYPLRDGLDLGGEP